MRKAHPLERLKKIYEAALKDTKIGLILGAGVSKASNMPDYSELAEKVFLAAYDSADDPGFRKSIKPKVKSYIESKLKLRELKPDEVFLLTKLNFRKDLGKGSDEWNRAWTLFCAEQLYADCIGLTDWRVKKRLYDVNKTLNALITFCAASPKDLQEPWKTQLQSSKGFIDVGINPRIGGILTTNYDGLFEAAFNHKYTRSKGVSYGMRPRLEGSHTAPQFDRMPVVHIHGYLSHNVDRYKIEEKPKSEIRLVDFVSAETDYFKAFYESMRFGNYAAMSFLENHHILFVGCSMEDQNLRRFLFHLRNATRTNTEKFAVLFTTCSKEHESSHSEGLCAQCLTPRDWYIQKVLDAYGVNVIWLCKFSDIPLLLESVYKSGKGIWDSVRDYKRS